MSIVYDYSSETTEPIEPEEGELYLKLYLEPNKNLMVEILDYTKQGGEDEKYLAPLAYGFTYLVEKDVEAVYRAGMEDMVQQAEMSRSNVVH